MQFQGGICPEKFRLNFFLNGLLLAIIVQFQKRKGVCPEKIQFDQILDGRLVAIIDSNMHNILKNVSDS